MTFSLCCSWIQYKHEASPCGLAWLWDTAGKLEIKAKAELLWEAHIWRHKNCLVLDQAGLPSLTYFKQYLFAVKSRKNSTMPSLALTMSPEDQYKPFFFFPTVLCVFSENRICIFPLSQLLVFLSLTQATFRFRQENLNILDCWEKAFRMSVSLAEEIFCSLYQREQMFWWG